MNFLKDTNQIRIHSFLHLVLFCFIARCHLVTLSDLYRETDEYEHRKGMKTPTRTENLTKPQNNK